MTKPPHPLSYASQKASTEAAEALSQYYTAELIAAPRTDPAWVSAIRGRLLAAMASALSLYVSGAHLVEMVSAVGRDGISAESGVAIVAHTGVVVDAAAALTVAAASLIALIASVGSKAREWMRERETLVATDDRVEP